MCSPQDRTVWFCTRKLGSWVRWLTPVSPAAGRQRQAHYKFTASLINTEFQITLGCTLRLSLRKKGGRKGKKGEEREGREESCDWSIQCKQLLWCIVPFPFLMMGTLYYEKKYIKSMYMETRLVSSSQRSTYLYLLSAGIKGVHHHFPAMKHILSFHFCVWKR